MSSVALPKHRIYATYTRGVHPPETLIECACGWSTEWQESHAQARSLYSDHIAETNRMCRNCGVPIIPGLASEGAGWYHDLGEDDPMSPYVNCFPMTVAEPPQE